MHGRLQEPTSTSHACQMRCVVVSKVGGTGAHSHLCAAPGVVTTASTVFARILIGVVCDRFGPRYCEATSLLALHLHHVLACQSQISAASLMTDSHRGFREGLSSEIRLSSVQRTGSCWQSQLCQCSAWLLLRAPSATSLSACSSAALWQPSSCVSSGRPSCSRPLSWAWPMPSQAAGATQVRHPLWSQLQHDSCSCVSAHQQVP